MKKKLTCDRCKKKTEQEKTSEGFAGKIYYEDFTCSVCGCINLFKKKKLPKHETIYFVSSSCPS